MNVRAGVTVAPWGRSLKDRGLAGSLFATVAGERLNAARALHSEGLAVHVDLIISADGSHRGVTPAQVRAVRACVLGVRVDLHLIVDGDAGAPATRYRWRKRSRWHRSFQRSV